MLTDLIDTTPAFTCTDCRSWVAATRAAFEFHKKRCANKPGLIQVVKTMPKGLR